MLLEKSMTKNVVTTHEGDNIVRARAKMTSYGIRHLPVVDDGDRLIGIVTDRDIRSAMPHHLTKIYANQNSIEHYTRDSQSDANYSYLSTNADRWSKKMGSDVY